jgi:hypothetical protein
LSLGAPLPPSDFERRRLSLELVPAKALLRIHRNAQNPIHFGKSGRNRFDAPDGEYGVLYAGFDLKTCFAEVFLREIFREPLPGKRSLFTESELAKYCVSELARSRTRLRLVSLIGEHALRLGADAEVTATSDYKTISQQWSRAIWRHRMNVDGIIYMSRPDITRRVVAIFDRVRGLASGETIPLLQHKDLPDILEAYDIGLID